jgi:alpha-tubulin suppressor-like RCC1 family protein
MKEAKKYLGSLVLVTEAHQEKIEEYCLNFDTSIDGGFAFPCDKDGNILQKDRWGREMSDIAIQNYNRCVSGEVKTIRPAYVKDLSRMYYNHAVCKCHCGKELSMQPSSDGLVYCECNRMYNTAGQSIRPRSEWEERYDDDY